MIRALTALVLLTCAAPAMAQDGMNAELLVAIQALTNKIDNLPGDVAAAVKANSLPPPVRLAQTTVPVLTDECGLEWPVSTRTTTEWPAASGLSFPGSVQVPLSVRPTPQIDLREITDSSMLRISLLDRALAREKTFLMGPYTVDVKPCWFRTYLRFR